MLRRPTDVPQRRHAETRRLHALLSYERALWRQPGCHFVCGVDEVGLGPLAGPVVAAAVVLPPTIGAALTYLNDSKKVSARRRECLFDQIRDVAVAWAIGWASEAEIDRVNIFAAARLAAERAVAGLLQRAPGGIDHLLLDAHLLPSLALPQTAIVGGDGRSQSIAAASILAKVARDAHMGALEGTYPGYGFARHMGYPTGAHMAALTRLGASDAHRRSFSPVAKVLAR